MPEFIFRLQPLLDQKLEAEAKAKAAVVVKMQELQNEQDALLQRLEAEKRVHRQVWSAREELLTIAGANAGADVQQRNHYLLGLQGDLKSAQDEVLLQKFAVEEAEISLQQARRRAVEVSREVEKLTKYCEKLKSCFLSELRRKEELEQDEMATALYLRRGAGS